MIASRLLLSLAAATLLLAAACSDATTGPALRSSQGAARYDEGGNSANAHACQQNGYSGLLRDDGTSFSTPGECTAYAAKGGTLMQGVRFSDIRLGGCNANTFGYEAGGVQHDLLSKAYSCDPNFTTMADTNVLVPLGDTARVYLRDNTCRWTFYEDEPHGIVTGSNPYFIRIGDGGGFCELPPNVNIWSTDTNRLGNLNVTETLP